MNRHRQAHSRGISGSLQAALAIGCLVTVAAALPAAAQSFSFGLWGDMPYAKAGDGPMAETAGSNVHWVKVTVEPDTRWVFTIHLMMVMVN